VKSLSAIDATTRTRTRPRPRCSGSSADRALEPARPGPVRTAIRPRHGRPGAPHAIVSLAAADAAISSGTSLLGFWRSAPRSEEAAPTATLRPCPIRTESRCLPRRRRRRRRSARRR
jgi:hypothetical protein